MLLEGSNVTLPVSQDAIASGEGCQVGALQKQNVGAIAGRPSWSWLMLNALGMKDSNGRHFPSDV